MIRSGFLLLCFPLGFPLACYGQTVQVPRAQALADRAMAEHPEMQTIGIHVTPPGWTQDLNIACSKPGKVGKLSADLDTGVARTGESSFRMTPKGAFDMGLPLHDASGAAVGMVVMVIRETYTGDAALAKRRAAVIRDELQSRIPSFAWLLEGATLVRSPAVMVTQTPLPEVRGEFGQLAFDSAGDRVFAAAPGNRSIEIFTLDGELVKSAAVAKEPNGLAFDPEGRVLLVADGASVLVLNRELQLSQRIALPGRADTGVYDGGARLFYLGVEGSVAIVSAAERKVVGRIATASQKIGGMALDQAAGRLFVSLRDRGQVAAVSVSKRSAEALWSLPELGRIGPMAVDSKHGRLFAAAEDSGKLAILDSQSGAVLQTLEGLAGAATLTFDAERNRLYLTGTGGLAIYFADGEKYRLDSKFGTMESRTSLYVPGRKQLYLVHAKNAEDGAGLAIYRID